MKFASVFGVTSLLALITLYEWQKINKNQIKEKRTLVCLTAAAWTLAVILILFPDAPGPLHLIELGFKPLGKFLEQ